MRFIEKLRSQSFWIKDILTGGKIKRHYNDVKFIFENSDSPKAVELHNKYLNNLLLHAVTTTPFYSHLTNFKSISDFPVVDKSVVRNNVEAHLSEKLKGQKLFEATTSGSTGAPFTVFKDSNKLQRHHAENIYFADIIESKLGTRLYYLRVWNAINRKTPLKSWMQNIVMQDASNLSDATFNGLLHNLQKDKSTKSILAFASSLEAFSNFIRRNADQPLHVNINAVISISETLPDGAKELLKQGLSSPVICRYSNIENGFLAQQCIAENIEYHLNLASFHFEILHPEKDEPAAPGEIGRIVVTDLFNYAMPLIRYNTGDMAILSEKSACGAQGPVLTKVEGRRVDFIYDTSDNILSPHVITNTMWKYAAIVRQFQFIQNSRDQFQIKLNCGNDTFEQTDVLISDLKSFVGNDADIDVEFVEDIPMLASGKRKKIINNYKPA